MRAGGGGGGQGVSKASVLGPLPSRLPVPGETGDQAEGKGSWWDGARGGAWGPCPFLPALCLLTISDVGGGSEAQ